MEEEERLKERLHEMSDYQSYDFSFKDSDLEREVRKQEDRRGGAVLQTWRWFYVVLIGITVALLSMVVNLGIAGLNSVKIKTTERLIYGPEEFWRPYFFYVGLSALYALFAAGIVAFWAPEAAGSGMSEIKAYFNGVHIPGLLSLRTLIAKLVSATFVLAAGLIAEGEAPFVHIGTIVGGGLTAAGSRSLTKLFGNRFQVRLPHKWGGLFRNDYDHRDFCAIGASAGIAVAFNAPISGMAFIAEESAANLGGPVFYRAIFGNCVALLVFNLLVAAYNAQGYFWNTRLFSQLDTSTASVLGLEYMRLWELPIVVAMSCIIGSLGSIFIALNSTLVYRIRHYLIPRDSRYRRTLEVVLLAIITGTIWFGISYGSPCAPLPPAEEQASLYPQPLPSNILVFISYDEFPQLWCAPGEYSLFGQVFMRPPRIMLRNLVNLSLGDAGGSITSLLGTSVTALHACMTFAMLTITYGAGASLGVITPVLQFGAACGLLVGHGVRAMAARIAPEEAVSLSLYAVVGAAAFLSGCVRYKSTAILIAMESTGAWFLIVPIAIAVFFAKLVADQFGRGLFETYLELSCVPVLAEPMTSSSVSSVTNQLSVADVMARGVMALPPVIAVSKLLHILQTAPYSSFPVTEEVDEAMVPGHEFHVLGVIERKAILKMLQHRVGFCTAASTCEHLPRKKPELMSLLSRFEQRPLKVDTNADQAAIIRGLEDSGTDAYLDLRPFMFRGPLLMQQGASLTRALSLFRQMGLHHILIAPPDPRAIGFITRRDLAMENAKLVRLRKKREAAQQEAQLENGHPASKELLKESSSHDRGSAV